MQRQRISREVMLEPKVFGNFTWKKIGFLVGGGLCVYLCIFGLPIPKIVSIPLALLPGALTVCLLFVSPHGQPFERFLYNFLLFSLKSRRKIWMKEGEKDLPITYPKRIYFMWYAKGGREG